MKRLMISLCALLALGACTSRQATDTLSNIPGAVAQEACRSSSNCRFSNTDRATGGAETPPEHWYEDSYGRDSRAPGPKR